MWNSNLEMARKIEPCGLPRRVGLRMNASDDIRTDVLSHIYKGKQALARNSHLPLQDTSISHQLKRSTHFQSNPLSRNDCHLPRWRGYPPSGRLYSHPCSRLPALSSTRFFQKLRLVFLDYILHHPTPRRHLLARLHLLSLGGRHYDGYHLHIYWPLTADTPLLGLVVSSVSLFFPSLKQNPNI